MRMLLLPAAIITKASQTSRHWAEGLVASRGVPRRKVSAIAISMRVGTRMLHTSHEVSPHQFGEPMQTVYARWTCGRKAYKMHSGSPKGIPILRHSGVWGFGMLPNHELRVCRASPWCFEFPVLLPEHELRYPRQASTAGWILVLW